VLRTPDIIAARAGRPVDLAEMEAEGGQPVSLRSLWPEMEWHLDLDTFGRTTVRLDFRAVPTAFVNVAKVAAWSGLVDPRGYHPPSVATIAKKMSSMSRVLAWIERSNATLADVDEELFEYFVEEVEHEAETGGLNSRVKERTTYGVVLDLLQPWTLLRDQRVSMQTSGIDALRDDPFARRTAEAIAKDISGDEKGKSDPLPDEVSVPVVEAAVAMAGIPAAEIGCALREYLAAKAVHGSDRYRSFTNNLPKLKFSALEDGGPPWLEVPDLTSWKDHERIVMHGLQRVVGGLVTTVFACGVPRPAELLSARAGIDDETGLPACVVRSRSSSELFDHYWMQGIRTKLTDGEPEPDEWLIGCAVAGDTQPPEAVEALIAIQDLLQPIRDLAKDGAGDRLLVSRASGFISLDDARVRPMGYAVMTDWVKVFLRDAMDWNDLPSRSRDGTDLTDYRRRRGANVTARAWRKTLVQFMLRIDGRMTLPLARRLRHKIHWILNQAYQSSDPALLEEVDDAMARTLARTLVGMANGDRPVFGWLGERMAGHLSEIRALTMGLGGEPAVAKVQDWARERQLGLLHTGPGKCGLRLMPRHALCHTVAGTAGWWQTRPSSERSDEHCASCKCCIVDDEHLHFWNSRYVAARRQVLISRRIGREGEAWVHAAQAAIAKNMLARLKSRVPTDREIEK